MNSCRSKPYWRRGLIFLYICATMIFVSGCNWEDGVTRTGDEIERVAENTTQDLADIVADSLGVTKHIAAAILASLDSAITTLDKNSAEWQVVLQELQAKLTNDVQGTLRIEIQNILNSSIAAVGSEFRCNTDFVGNRVKEQLEQLKAKITRQAAPPLQPVFCAPVPAMIEYQAVTENRVPAVQIYGYNFDNVAPLRLFLEDNEQLIDVTKNVAQPSSYVITINLGSNGVRLTSRSERLKVEWAGQVIYTIAVVQPHATATPTPSRTATRVPTRTPTYTPTPTPRPVYSLVGHPTIKIGGGSKPLFEDSIKIIACPPGFVATGIIGREGHVVDQIGLNCKKLDQDGILSQKHTTVKIGGSAGEKFNNSCKSDNSFLRGIEGKAGAVVDSIKAYCSNIKGAESGFTSTAGGESGKGYTSHCAPDFALTGLRVSTGVYGVFEVIGYIGIECTKIQKK